MKSSFKQVVIDLRNNKIVSTHKTKELALKKAMALNKKLGVRYYKNATIYQ